MMLASILAAAVLEGPFPLLCTPWTEKAELDAKKIKAQESLPEVEME